MMTLEEMGACLRQEREQKGLTLEAAAAVMKISKRYLIALEEGRTSCLPHPVYAKGFLKSYARLLGLDPEEMGGVLAHHYGVEDDNVHAGRTKPPKPAKPSMPPTPEGPPRVAAVRQARTDAESLAAVKEEIAPPAKASDTPADEKIPAREKPAAMAAPTRSQAVSGGRVLTIDTEPRGFKPSLWLVLPLLVVFAGLVWFFFSSFIGHETPRPSDTGVKKAETKASGPETIPLSAAAQPQAADGQKPVASAGQTAGAAPESVAPGSGTPGNAGAVGTGARTPADQAVNPEKLASEAKFAVTGNQTVEITAKASTPLEVVTEDGQTRSFTLIKGQRLSLRFNDKISVHFGRTESVAVKVNGKDYPLGVGGTDGKNVTF